MGEAEAKLKFDIFGASSCSAADRYNVIQAPF